MAKMTLLEIVQDISNDISSDFVNSIDDTEESQMIAQIVKSTFFAMMSNRNWPHLKRTVSLSAYGDSSYPVHMRVDENIKELLFVNYDKRKTGETQKRYAEVKYLEPDAFLFKTNQNNSDSSSVDTLLDPSGITILVRNDTAPSYYTSFDDNVLVFDSYDSLVDTTLQSSKFQTQAYIFPSWTHSDDAVPDLPAEAFTALLEEAKSRASLKLTSEADQKAEQEAGRQNRWLARKAYQVEGGIKYPNYGRTSKK